MHREESSGSGNKRAQETLELRRPDSQAGIPNQFQFNTLLELPLCFIKYTVLITHGSTISELHPSQD